MNTPIRLRFSKDGPLRFIGHLDFLRVFQQTLRRSGLPAAYSQGFNPHMRVSFALPLSLGMASKNDYADFELLTPVPFCEIVESLNKNAPAGLVFTQATEAVGRVAALVCAADYLLEAEIPSDDLKNILAQKEIIVPKKTKSGVKETDIRPDIFDIQKNGSSVLLKLAAGSTRFINPLTVAKLLDPSVEITQLTRLELYDKDFNPL